MALAADNLDGDVIVVDLDGWDLARFEVSISWLALLQPLRQIDP